jgi:chromosome segregation ATPase
VPNATLAPAAAQPEPTLKDILNAVNGLGTRMDRFEVRMDGFETRFDGLETRFDGLETRFDGLETRFDGLEVRVVSVESEIKDLAGFVREQFVHTTAEIAKLRAADEEHVVRLERIEATLVAHDVHFERIEAGLDEVIRLARDNQRIGLKNQEDIARIDRKLDAHLADHEIHLPRPRSMEVPDVGPMAA